MISTAELNAKALDCGQLGGVYTAADSRGKGYAQALIKQLINSVHQQLNISTLIICTGENNLPARHVYEKLGAKSIGYFALLFGNS